MARTRLVLVLLAVTLALASLSALAAQTKRPAPQGERPPAVSPEIRPGGGWGGAPWSFDESPYVPGVTDRDPRLSALVRDIIVLRLVNRAALTPEQIRKVLPPLRQLAKDQRALSDRAAEALATERTQLLKESGPPARPARPLKTREWFTDYRANLDRAKDAITAAVPPTQAVTLIELIDPGSSFRNWPAPSPGQAGSRTSGRTTSKGQPRPGAPPVPGGGSGSGAPGFARPPMMYPLIDVGQLVELLEEKLAAMPAAAK